MKPESETKIIRFDGKKYRIRHRTVNRWEGPEIYGRWVQPVSIAETRRVLAFLDALESEEKPRDP